MPLLNDRLLAPDPRAVEVLAGPAVSSEVKRKFLYPVLPSGEASSGAGTSAAEQEVYSSRVWGCAWNGQAGLTFEEAAAMDTQAAELAKQVCLVLSPSLPRLITERQLSVPSQCCHCILAVLRRVSPWHLPMRGSKQGPVLQFPKELEASALHTAHNSTAPLADLVERIYDSHRPKGTGPAEISASPGKCRPRAAELGTPTGLCPEPPVLHSQQSAAERHAAAQRRCTWRHARPLGWTQTCMVQTCMVQSMLGRLAGMLALHKGRWEPIQHQCPP